MKFRLISFRTSFVMVMENATDEANDLVSEASEAFPVNLDNSLTRKAKVLLDYEATSPNELSALKNEILIIYRLPGMDQDYVMAEANGKKGQIPFSYLELI